MTTLIRDARRRHAVGLRELARRSGVAPPTVVDWERSEAAGTIRVATLRRALAALGERLAVRSVALTIEFKRLERREQRLGLELHRSIAMKLVTDPDAVLKSARSRLGSMRPGLRGGAPEWLDQWAQLIDDRDVGGLIVVMLGTSQHDIDMRSVSPFTGLLSPEERQDVLVRSSTTPARQADGLPSASPGEQVGAAGYSGAMSRLDRITSDPAIMHGRPVVRGMRIRVTDVLSLLATGATHAEILADYEYLEEDDILACLEYAAAASDHPVFVAS